MQTYYKKLLLLLILLTVLFFLSLAFGSAEEPCELCQLCQNKALVRRMFDAMNNQDWELFEDLHDPNAFYWFDSRPVYMVDYWSGRYGYDEVPSQWDPSELKVEDIFAEGDKVAVRLYAGHYYPDPASTVWLTYICIFQIADEKIVTGWIALDSNRIVGVP